MQGGGAGASAGASGPGAQFASLYIGDLNADVTEAMLYEIFNAVGPVASIRVCRDSVSRKSLGYAYVNYHNVADAERALDTLNYSQIKGRSCRVMWSQRDPATRKMGSGNIFVKNLDKNIDNKALYDTFSLFGNILSCKVAMDASGNSKGYGFVHYETDEAGKQAIERVNNMQIGEKCVFVGPFVKGDNRDTEPKHFTNVYVKNFPKEWDEDKVKGMFAEFGTITSFFMNEDKYGRKAAFVNYETVDQAKAAIEKKNGEDLRTDEEKAGEEECPEDKKLFVSRAQSKSERQAKLRREMQAKTSTNDGVNLYVKNLDETIDDDRLKALFASFGTITSHKVARDEKGMSKGFGFVCFTNPEEATKAVTEMHLKRVGAKPLYVGLAEKREQRVARLQQRFRNGPGGMGGMGGMMGMGGMGGMMGYGMGMGMGKGMGKGMQSGYNQQQMGMRPAQRPGMMPYGMQGMQGMGMQGMGGMQGMQGMMGMQGMQGMRPQGGMGMMGKGMPGKGGMQGGMPGGKGMMQARPVMAQQPQARPAQPFDASQPLTAAALAAAPPGMQKQMLGEKLFPAIARMQPEMAGKITGMMLEMDNSELLILLESPDQLKNKVDEALRVLESRAG